MSNTELVYYITTNKIIVSIMHCIAMFNLSNKLSHSFVCYGIPQKHNTVCIIFNFFFFYQTYNEEIFVLIIGEKNKDNIFFPAGTFILVQKIRNIFPISNFLSYPGVIKNMMTIGQPCMLTNYKY